MRALIITAGAIILAAFAGLQALIQVTQTSNPRVALAISPGSPMALAADAERRWRAAPGDAAVRAQVEREARRSLEAMPFNPRGLRLLGFAAEGRGASGKARALLTLADRLTRRDIDTQLWLIEDNVRAGRVDQTLVHYDTALRTNARSGILLYPILGAAIADPDIQKAMARYLSPPAPWVTGLVRASIESGTELGPLARTLAKYGQVPARSLQNQLLNALLAAGRYYDALLYFRAIPGAQPALLQSVAFDTANTDPILAPIAWQPLGSEVASVALEPTAAGGRRYHVAIGADDSVGALRKILYLPAGTYRLEIQQSILVRGGDAKIAWQIACLAAPAASKTILAVTATQPRTAATFTVPAGCRAQELGLAVSSGEGDDGLEFYVDRLTLTRSLADQASAPQ